MLAACGAAFAVPCAAVEAEAPADTVALRDLEIVANRATAKTPVAYSSITKREIEKVNDGRDIPFILSMTPSLISTSDAGAGVGYSGLRVRGTDATRINVTANGVPINDSESHIVYWVNMPDLASSLRDIQIQRGAGTSTNGAGAFGASVNMLTDAPAEEAYAEAMVSYGSYNTHKETVRAGSGLLGDRWSVDVRLSNIGSDGYIDRASSNLWSYLGQVAFRDGGTSLRLLAFGGKEETYMAWDYASKEEMEQYGRRYNPCGKYTASDGSVAFYPDQKDNFIQHHIQLLYGQTLGEYWRLSAALHYTKGDGYYEQLKKGRTLIEYGLTPFTDAAGQTVKKSDLVRLKFNDNDFYGMTASAVYTRGRVNATIGGAANNFHGGHFGRVAWVRNYMGAIDPLLEAAAAAVEEVEDEFKSFRPFVVRIGNVVVSHRPVDKRRHGDDFLFSLRRRCHSAQIFLIVGVHGYDKIEVIEIRWRHLAADMGKLDAPAARMDAHTFVGQLAYVPASGAGRIDLPAGLVAFLADDGTHHALGCGRAAYVAEAYK